MNFVGLTKESLESALEREIPDVHLLIAKNSVLGLDAYGIAEILGVDPAEVAEIEALQEYKELRVHVAARVNQASLDRDFGWDDIETQALKNIGKRVANETDIETNLKIAAVANRAQRRHQKPINNPLDAGAAGSQVKLILTRRMIERLTSDGTVVEREQSQEVRLRDGTISNPSFADIDRHLGISARPRIPSNLSFRTSEPAHDEREDLNPNDLNRLMSETLAKRNKS